MNIYQSQNMNYSDGGSQPGTMRRGVNDWTPSGRANSMVVYGGGKTTDSEVYRVGIYGWRKRCLYCLILLLTIVIVINLALTIWILSVLDFNMNGLGGMKITKNGIRVTGRTEFEREINFRSLRSPENEYLYVDSDKGVVLQSRGPKTNGSISARLVLENGEARAECDRFEIGNQKNTFFSVDNNEVAVHVENIRILDEGGSVFDGSVQTPLVRPETDMHLRLESPTRSLKVRAAENVEIETNAGDIRLEALQNIDLESKNGEIRLTAPNIFITRLMQSTATENEPVDSQFQLCICHNGRLFVAAASTHCRASRGIC